MVEEILINIKLCGDIGVYINNGIVPNLTTSGIDMSDVEIELMKKYCGAVAISMYSKVINDNGKFSESNPKTIEAINKL